MKAYIIFIASLLIIIPFKVAAKQSNDTIVLPPQEIKLIRVPCHHPSLKPKVINSESEYKNSFCYNDKNISYIDFSKKTLLYFPTMSGGCKGPTNIRTVTIIGNLVIYHITVIQHGYCKMLITLYNTILIPKLRENCIVKFKVTKKQE